MDKNGKKGGISVVLLLGVGLVLLLGALNYFNIFPLSTLFPNYLGWLPHQERKDNSTNLANNLFTPTISIEKQALNILISFLSQNLSPSFVPTSSDVSLNQYNKIPNTLNATWDINQGKANAIFAISQDQKSISSINIYFSREDDVAPSVPIAKNLTSEFFSLTPQGTWGCKPLASKGVYCENFWQDSEDIKMGIGLQQPSIQNQDKRKKAIFLCLYNKTSENYFWKSCSSEFADKGI